jgi:methyl-accepting chemotaxis protein
VELGFSQSMMRQLVPFVVAATLFAAGCGGSDEDAEAGDLTVWAGQLCTAVSGWAEELTATGDALRESGISQDALQDAADGVKSATDTLVADLRDLPEPETDAGQQAKASADELADDLEQEAASIEDAVDGVSGPSDVVSAIATVSAALATMGDQVRSAVDEVEQADPRGELEQAFQDAAPCRELSGFRAG